MIELPRESMTLCPTLYRVAHIPSSGITALIWLTRGITMDKQLIM